MDIREALYTTRAMRRMKPDPVPDDVQARILDAAVRAPSGGNSQDWKFLVVDDPAVKGRMAPLYEECIAGLWTGYYREQAEAAAADPDAERSRAFRRMQGSATHLAEHFAEVPMLLFAFCRFDTSGGSIYPAVWSAMLAARAEGVGSSIAGALLFKKDEVLSILGVPADSPWNMTICVAFGYPTGRWGVAARRPAHEVAFRNQWGTPLGIDIPKPLWP